MKKPLISLVSLLWIAIYVLSCREDRTSAVYPLTQTLISDGLALRDGRLVFRDVWSFKSTIEGLKAMSEVQRKEWSQKAGLTSLQDVYDTAEGVVLNRVNPIFKTKQKEYPFVADVLFARLINQNGMFKIADSVHRIVTGGKELITSKKNVELLTSQPTNSKIDSHDVLVELRASNVDSESPNARTDAFDLSIAQVGFGNDDFVFAVLRISSFVGYVSYSMRLEMRHKSSWWIFTNWHPRTASYMELTAGIGGRIWPGFGDIPFAAFGEGGCDSCSDINVFMDEYYGSGPRNVDAANGNYDVTYNGKNEKFPSYTFR